MPPTPLPHPREPESRQYEILVQEHLDQRWAEWFDSLTLMHQSDGSTILVGTLADQTALHGVLHKIRDLALTIIAIQLIDKKDED